MNKAGKTSTIFLVVFSVLLLSLTAITIFFFQKEREMRKNTEVKLEISEKTREKTEQNLNDFKVQVSLLQDRLKEADEKINNSLDDLELEKGLREESKREILTLKESFNLLKGEKDKIQKEVISLREEKVSLGEKLSSLEDLKKEFSIKLEKKEEELRNLQKSLDPVGVELDKIVVTSSETTQAVSKSVEFITGKILKINKRNNFIIINVGSSSRVSGNQLVEIYRGKTFLGKAKITRVQTSMSVADILKPLSARNLRIGDKVIIKE